MKPPRRLPLSENLLTLSRGKFMSREIITNFVTDYLKRQWSGNWWIKSCVAFLIMHFECAGNGMVMCFFFLSVFTQESQLEFVSLYLLLCE